MRSNPKRTKSEIVSDFRRTQILDSARQNFIRHGVADTTVDGIARSAGVAKGTVYLYYKSKDEIFRQIVSSDLKEFHDSTVPGLQADGALESRLQAFLAATLEFFDRKRDFFDHCQLEVTLDVRKKMRQQYGLVFASQTKAWADVLERARRAGEVHVTDIPGTACSLVSLAHGLAIQRLRGWYTGPVDQVIASASALVLKGLRS